MSVGKLRITYVRGKLDHGWLWGFKIAGSADLSTKGQFSERLLHDKSAYRFMTIINSDLSNYLLFVFGALLYTICSYDRLRTPDYPRRGRADWWIHGIRFIKRACQCKIADDLWRVIRFLRRRFLSHRKISQATSRITVIDTNWGVVVDIRRKLLIRWQMEVDWKM